MASNKHDLHEFDKDLNADPEKNMCWYMYKYLFLLISVLPLLHSCYEIGGKDHLAKNSTPTIQSDPDDPDPVSVSLASQVIEELKSSLSSFVSLSSARDSNRKTERITLSFQDLDLLIAGAEKSISENNLENSENLILILPKVAEGAQISIKGMTPIADGDNRTMSLVGTIGASMIKSINGRSQYLTVVSAKTSSSPLETALSGVTQASISNLDEAGLPTTLVAMASRSVVGSLVGSLDDGGLSKNEIGGALKNITSKAVDSLDQIEGVSATEITSSLKEITAGATSALDEIEITDYSATDLGDMVQEISSGATEALGNIKIDGISSDNLSSMMEKVTAGATSALGQISMEGYSANNLSTMLGKITAGATSALGDIEMDGYDSSKLGEMVEKITSGATSALDEIEMAGYSSDNLSSMVEEITSGATGALDEIEMTGFDPATDVYSVTERVILGTTGALGEIEMEGYDSDDLEGMLEGVTSGAMSAINDLQNAGFDQNSMPNMMKSISSSASRGLSRLENTKFLDNASKLPGLLNTITSSTIRATKDIKVQGFDPENSATLGSIIEEVISGATESIEEMTMASESGFDLQKTLNQIATGAISGAKNISSDSRISDDIQKKALDTLKQKTSQLNLPSANSVVLDELDMTSPILISTIPQDSASNFFIRGKDAWTEEPVTVIFNEELDQLSVSLRSIEVSGPEGKVPGTLKISTLGDNSTLIKFLPSENLEYNTSYVLKVMETIRDVSGNRLEEGRTINFVTEYPIVFIPKLNSPPFITHMFSTRLNDSDECNQRCFVVEARLIDTNKSSEMTRIWRVDNQTVESSQILDFVITDTDQGDPRTELISAIFLHDVEGVMSFEVLDSDNQSDQRELKIP